MVIDSPSKPAASCRTAAFSLIEMMAVIAILVILMTAGINLISGTGFQTRKVAAETLIALVEQARTRAITSKSYTLLAIIEPADLPNSEDRCRVGIFQIKEWPPAPAVLEGELPNHWLALNRGVILISGEVSGMTNPMDLPKIAIHYGGEKNLTVMAHVIGFNSRGGLHYPLGSASIIVRLAEGGYHLGIATPHRQGQAKVISENLLKIGRVAARPYRIDG